MSQHALPNAPDEFLLRLLRSRRFDELYAEVMDVVERCAAYLEGDGRKARAMMAQADQAAFARMSMWLTASLMRSASIVLVLRAVGKGEMSVAAALRETESTRRAAFSEPPAEFPGIPETFAALMDDGMRVREGADRFVAALNGDLPRPSESPALRQIRELKDRLGLAAGLG